MSAPIPARTWHHAGLHTRRLTIGETVAGDDVVQVRIDGIADGLVISLSADQVAEVADGCAARAALMRGSAVTP